MLLIGSLLCAIAGVMLLGISLAGRPTRGENLVGSHLVTGPGAIAFTLGAILVQVACPLPTNAANVTLGLLWPAILVGVTFLPLASYTRRGAVAAKVAMVVVVAAPFLLGHGGRVHPSLAWLGAGVLATLGLTNLWALVGYRMRRWLAPLWRLGRAPQPSEWERNQAAWQRGQWQQVPADASVAMLLCHARSLAPDVRAACHARLAAHADFEPGIAAALRSEQPGQALWYVTHHCPRSPSTFAAPVRELLARLRATWPERLRHDPHPRPWAGDLIDALDCATAVLLAGGDVRAELQAWQQELATMPKFARLAKQLGRWLRKAG
jgi:hypothetical protein